MSASIDSIKLITSFIQDEISYAELNSRLGPIVWDSIETNPLVAEIYSHLVDYDNQQISKHDLLENFKSILSAFETSVATTSGCWSSYAGGNYRFVSSGDVYRFVGSRKDDQMASRLLSA